MKKIYSILSGILLTASVLAQAPQKMSYQAVIRNSSNALVTSTAVGMKISVLQGSATGTATYVETQNPTTNANGLVSLEIGNGTAVTGTFAGIKWAEGPYFIKTETDPTGGVNYTIQGTNELMSVPYALFSANSTPGPKGDKGETGTQGLKGDQGNQGIQGVQGEIGLTGSKGDKGVSGDQGIKGDQGIQGIQGVQGEIGLTGSKGDKGETGTQGLKGDQGNQGIQGVQGEIGLTGPKGDKGVTGDQGIQGFQGARGEKGADGADGLNGAPGAKGDKGDKGETGVFQTGSAPGQMNYWNGSAWVTVPPGGNGYTLAFFNGVPYWRAPIESNDIYSPTTGKIWMDRNLGASQVATSSTDAASYGDLYQWGRGADGHQLRTSTTTATLSSTDVPGNANFILPPNSPYDWLSTQNDNLWQGVNGVNNPCPSGFRIPTDTELNAERLSWSANNSIGAFASPLKLPLAGYRDRSDGSLYTVSVYGYCWSSTVDGTYSRYLNFFNGLANVSRIVRAYGFSVRCIKD